MARSTKTDPQQTKRPPRGVRKPVALNGRMPASEAGRVPKVHHFTNAEIDRMVNGLIANDRSYERRLVLELLYRYVTLTEDTLFRLVHEQVAISDNIRCFNAQLSRYRADGLIANLPKEAVRRAIRAGLPEPESGGLRAYYLGPVGEAYVARKGWNGSSPPPTVTEEHLMHDLICAETMLKMQSLWAIGPDDRRGLIEVRGPRQVAVWDAEKKAYLASPDGLLIKRDMDGKAVIRTYVVEYHNSNSVLNVKQKVKRYEELAKGEYAWVWRDYWESNEMPVVLVLYRHEANKQHYVDALSACYEHRAIYGLSWLDDVWSDRLSIIALKTQTRK
ncbi:MAG: replication-relaxation family protein [Anaerolineales bacterium]|nr:replication-relaxation family protein [Anaerolineales bacterium]